ncbi:hypothetical protein BGW36DRAFT_355196 [Talaromyces proteolyticus]|uniref:Fungal N-terminal domain-containing protein n=1 Tax=Talaromyces proteolyticus TaxID=1131652 RepID=A0AAD4L047_9EURO|nr:uncharacterized protein BGW36DRAFT_355196 [Talaromyces proteolyticus]KAH8703793.1 hypothetical protein BGW36DRAFT_355196 [Talaromyces proteolyticus]
MSFGFGFGDLVRFIEIATTTYRYGFSKVNRAPSLYSEFGDNVKGLAANLKDLHKVIESLSQNGQPRDSSYTDSSYGVTLVDIIGDYGRTLQDCEKFLKDKECFKWKDGFITNIFWNFNIAGKVQGLKDRVTFLNIKLMTVLKTLDVRMANELHINIFRIHHDLAMRIDGAQDRIIETIQRSLAEITEQIRTGTTSTTSNLRHYPSVLDIPTSLESLFEQKLQRSGFGSDPDQFPLVRGLDAVVYHMSAANTIEVDSKDSKMERQWLAIAKALWTIARVKAGQEYRDACSFRPSSNFEIQMRDWGITVASYVKGLEIELVETIRTSSIHYLELSPQALVQTFEANPEMWFEVEDTVEATPTWELSYSEKIMDASLRGPFPAYDQTIHIFRLTSVDLKLVITDSPRPGTVGEKTNTIIPVDMRRSRLIPLYATSKSTAGGDTWNVSFQGDRLAPVISALGFNKRTELFKFQHVITGYQVVLESVGIEAITFNANKILGGKKSKYVGRLQLWRAKTPRNSLPKDSPTVTGGLLSSTVSGTDQSRIMEPASPSSISSGSPSDSGPQFSSSGRRRDSSQTAATTTTSSASSIPVSIFGTSIHRKSTFTGSSSELFLSPNFYTTSIVSNNGTVGVVLEKPEPSLLVLLLQRPSRSESGKASNPTPFSSLAIEIDENTTINSSSCECSKDPSSCKRVVLEKDGKALRSFRQDAASLEEWNLAELGKDRKKELVDDNERLLWVGIDFGTTSDKIGFEKMFNNLRILWGQRKKNMDWC